MARRNNLNLRLHTKETAEIYTELLVLKETLEFIVRKREYIENECRKGFEEGEQ